MRRLIEGLTLAVLCAAVVIVSARYGSFVAGGSDSYCYVHQAERWASGRLLAVDPLALDAPWPDAPLTFAPAGHIPSPTVRGAIAPICPSGLSMVMALFLAVGGRAAMFSVIPLAGVVLVLATCAFGARLGPGVGLASAALVAASPVFLYQVIQPMSDVPAAACWLVALACATAPRPRSVWAGVATALAILVRPNLVPLGFVIGVYLLCRPDRPWAERLRAGALYAGGSAVGCASVAAIQWHFYGSPFASGYGPAATIFAFDRVVPNASRYASWLLEAQGPLILVALAAPLAMPRALAVTGLAFIAGTVAIYLPYLVFEDWSYVRFLLPAIPVGIVLALGTIASLARSWRGGAWAAAAVWLAAVVMIVPAIPVARRHQVFRLAGLESDFARAGAALAPRLPPNAVVITSRYSGSVRFYAGRRTVAWDVLDPAWLDPAVSWLSGRGYAPYLLLASGEESAFRQRFAASDLARLDWPPLVEIAPAIRVYEPAARGRYLRGESIATQYVR